jgi:hypothetical protein
MPPPIAPAMALRANIAWLQRLPRYRQLRRPRCEEKTREIHLFPL